MSFTPKPIRRAQVLFDESRTRKTIFINSSAMGLLRACERKADYILNQGFGAIESSPAQHFGNLIHQALASYYLLSREHHTEKTILEIWDQVAKNLESDHPQRNKEVGARVLANYAKTYPNDPWMIAEIDGKVAVEIAFEKTLIEAHELDIVLFGTIDLIVQNQDSGEYAVMDHKTALSIGKEFLTRWKPNHQMSAYIWALQNCFKLKSNKAIINGLQIAKTVHNVCRIETHRTEEELQEFKSEAIRSALILDSELRGMADATTCSSFGGCVFLDVCSTTPSLRPTVLSSLKNRFNPEVHYGSSPENH